jgi:hypothetical protein
MRNRKLFKLAAIGGTLAFIFWFGLGWLLDSLGYRELYWYPFLALAVSAGIGSKLTLIVLRKYPE